MKWILIVMINFQMPMFEPFDTREQCSARLEQLVRDAQPGDKEAALLCVRADKVVRISN